MTAFSHIATYNASCIGANEEAAPDVAPESCLKIPLQSGIECRITGVVFASVGTAGDTRSPARVQAGLPWSYSASFAFSLLGVSDEVGKTRSRRPITREAA